MTKQEIIAKFGRKEGDTGSSEVQIALLTERINHLTEHGLSLPQLPLWDRLSFGYGSIG